MKNRSIFLPVVTGLGFLFLYAPIASLIVFSFNESKLVTVWGGFSTKWYGELLRDPQILGAAWISLKIAFLSATLAIIIGTVAAFALSRFPKFRTKSLLNWMITAPLVMPDVIIGLSLLLMFVAMQGLIGWPAGRGMTTIIIAHATFGAAYAAVVIQSRLVDMDMSIEEVALDLGAKPMRVFFDITLPVIAPALVSGWLLAFTLSLDDLVIASFVSGPGSSTLPMVIFSKVRLGVSPDVNALATIIILIISVGIIAAAIQISRSGKKLGN
ncbi:MAG: putrescine ABC transporter permease PotI [Robiginitomaculum sp.]|nr:MAG: putrescine ABC transporter permease PotI [Robiginitomaculum sp.]